MMTTPTAPRPRSTRSPRSPLFAALSAGVLAVTLALAGCSGGAESVGAKDPTSQTTAPLSVAGSGPTRFVADALGDVPLRADQRTTLEGLLKDAEARHAPLAAKRKAIGLELADMVEKGTVDEAALKAKTDAIDAELEGVLAKDREAIGQAHALLDKAQRHALVEALETRGKDAWKHARHGGPGEHGPRPEGAPPAHEGPGARGPHGPHGGFDHGPLALARKLDLTDAQKDQIKEIMKAEMTARHEARGPEGEGPGAERGEHGPRHHGAFAGMRKAKAQLEAFERDDFDAKTTLKGPAGHGGRGMAQGFVHLAARITPILTPEQRVKAATELRARATHEGFGHAPPPAPADAPAPDAEE